jgi:hypothetical protein
MLTHGATPMIALAARAAPDDRLARICYAIGKAQRALNGRLDGSGFPYIDCDRSSLHLQTGSSAAGLLGALKAGDDELAQYYRDCCRPPAVLDIYGHGQRSEQILHSGRDGFLHATLSDFYLRVNELASGEDLWLHPAVFGRYFDCVDVNADLCQRTDMAGKKGWYRAAYLRGQAHEHHFEDWAAAPFLGVLSHTQGTPLGLTEACYFAEHLMGQPINEMQTTICFHIDHATRDSLRRYLPAKSPLPPTKTQVSYSREGNRVRWQPSATPAVQGYRIYRGESVGGPWVLLNSPYAKPAAALLRGQEFVDSEGQPHHHYLITAVDLDRRESRWFGDEPLPR